MDRTQRSWPNEAVAAYRDDSFLPYRQVISFPKTIVYTDPDFTVWTEIIQIGPGKLMTFLHLEFQRWSLSSYKRLKHLWPSFRQTLPPIIYACGSVCDAKWVKFLRHTGWKPLVEDCLCSDGTSRPIYFNMQPQAVPMR